MQTVLFFMPTHKKTRHRRLPLYFLKNFGIVFGLVLIWRGIWYTLDYVDTLFFANAHHWTALIGIIVGFALLYLPDKELDEISKH